MKYNDENLTIKDTIPARDYCMLVDSIWQVQLFNGEYHPEYLTTALPSIIAHSVIDGIEWEDDERNMFNDDVVEKIYEANDELTYIVNEIMYSDLCPIFSKAVKDAEKIIQYRLQSYTPLNNLLITVNDMITKFADELKDIDTKNIIDALASINEGYPVNKEDLEKAINKSVDADNEFTEDKSDS